MCAALPKPIVPFEGWPIRAPGLVMDAAGPVMAIVIGPSLSDADWARHCLELGKVIDSRRPGVKLGVFYHVAAAYSRARASQMLEVLKPRQEILTSTTAAFVYCTSSAMARTALRFMFTFVPPPYANAVVKDARHGFDFLQRHVPDVQPEVFVAWHQRLAADAGVPA